MHAGPGHVVKPHWHVRTPSGVLLTDVGPPDHPWHEGLSVAVPSVTARGRTSNCWGGGTYVPGRGYVDRDDHGSWVERGRGRIDWLASDGSPVLTERRTLRQARAGQDDAAWRLDLRSELRPVDGPVTLGSPGSAGREGAGYGGWFWRFPSCSDVAVTAAGGRSGEAAVHGTVADWVCWSAVFPGGAATVLLAGADAVTRADPWFVRVAEYPAIGSAVAWSTPTDVPAAGLRRGLDVVVADGRRTPDELRGLLGPG